ncbi:NAD(P)H-binding protein [Erythrobacter sp.]|uniref:NAD(P)H-binding protein n=1 Tax=Erythrobacter sp. TaxID=1042 RepID=UPI0025ED568E|nr:NAD(P)H-binding protein [Erythrobacter sp.]
MSETRGPARIALVGATGLIGRAVIERASASDDVRIVGVARREAPLPAGARMEMFVAEPDKWGEVFEAVRPRALICALGTTWKKAGRDEAAFRSVDHDLVLATAQAAHRAGVPNMVLVSAAGADPRAKSLYMRVKGETEAALSKVGFKRLDIFHPGLLRGERVDDLRFAERAALIAAPLVDPLLSGSWQRFRSIEAGLVAEAALSLALRRAGGRFTHDNEAMRRAARQWRQVHDMEAAE